MPDFRSTTPLIGKVFGPLGLVRMSGRDTGERHRGTSPLELFFDLVFVVAVSQASQGLHEAIADPRGGASTLTYGMIFFAIWWAWVNFTWFASAFDTDDWLYRLTTFVQMGGVLVLAAGVQPAMTSGNWAIVTWGYVIMRIAMILQWMRLALSDPEQRAVAIRFAAGIGLAQIVWVARIAFSADVQFWTFWPAALLEILVPIWAEHSRQTPWHPNHIADRYGCFTLIVLGESVLASSNAIIEAFGSSQRQEGLVGLAVWGVVIAASMWWIYFSFDQSEYLSSRIRGFYFGYAHYFVLAAAGAVSIGIEVELDILTGKSQLLSASAVALALALPVALFMGAVWAVMLRGRIRTLSSVLYLGAVALILIAALVKGMTIYGVVTGVVIGVLVVESERIRSKVQLVAQSE